MSERCPSPALLLQVCGAGESLEVESPGEEKPVGGKETFRFSPVETEAQGSFLPETSAVRSLDELPGVKDNRRCFLLCGKFIIW